MPRKSVMLANASKSKTLAASLTYEPVELEFGTSGLRGLVVDMTDLECYINTVGFLKYLSREDGLELGKTVFIGGDLRESTPRIMAAVTTAIVQAGYKVINYGLIPTPTLAFYALEHDTPSIMV